jgi:tetratricopeptide (TPR) repeat protein
MLGEYGETVVVDWGLAKVLEQDDPEATTAGVPVKLSANSHGSGTQFGQVIGTPAFMSPEQARGETGKVCQASDVFSLGAILYDLLTGKAPFAAANGDAALELARKGEVVAARQREPGVPRALEAVCAKALAASPERRYGGAKALAADVRRWLADEPVTAYREPVIDRVRRWGRRHRSVVSAGGMLVLAGVVGLAVGLVAVRRERDRTAVQRDEARRATERAERNEALAAQNFEKTREALDEAKRNLEQADRNLQLARQAVDDCFVLATSEPGMKEEAAAPFRRRLLAAARPYYREFARRRPGDPAFDLDLARNLTRLALIEADLGDHDEARRQADRVRELCAALAKQPNLSAADLQALADCMNNVGTVPHTIGDLDDAVAAQTAAYQLQERLARERPDDFRARFHLCLMAHNVGLSEQGRGRLKEARTWGDLSLKLGGELLEKHSDNGELLSLHVASWRGRAGLHQREKEFDEADKAYREGEDWGRKLLKRGAASADDVLRVATTFSDHAAMLSNRGNPAKARPLFLEAIALQEPLCQKYPEVRFLHLLGIMTGNLGRVCALLDRPDESEAAWEKSRAVWAEVAARRPKDARVAEMYKEANQAWTMAHARKADRLIKASDASGAAAELERVASITPACKAGLISGAAACGRWLKAFEKDDKVGDAQRDRVAALCTTLLHRAKKEGMLDEAAKAWIRKEPSFAPMRGRAAFDKLVAEVKDN